MTASSIEVCLPTIICSMLVIRRSEKEETMVTFGSRSVRLLESRNAELGDGVGISLYRLGMDTVWKGIFPGQRFSECHITTKRCGFDFDAHAAVYM